MNSDQESNNSFVQRKSIVGQESVFILGDSMVRKINDYHMTKDLHHRFLVKVRPFKTAKIVDMVDHVKPTLRDFDPDWIILHVGTNDLNSSNTASQIAKSLIDVANSIKTYKNHIVISLIVPRNDGLNNKANEVNSRLKLMCIDRGFRYIDHHVNIEPQNHLNESKLHLNRSGLKIFEKNFTNFLYHLF